MNKSSESVFHLCETEIVILAPQYNLLDFEGISTITGLLLAKTEINEVVVSSFGVIVLI